MSPLWFRLASRAAVVFDIGAQVGFYTLLAAHANPRGRIFSFEPHPTGYERLVRHVALNRAENVRCFEAPAEPRSAQRSSTKSMVQECHLALRSRPSL